MATVEGQNDWNCDEHATDWSSLIRGFIPPIASEDASYLNYYYSVAHFLFREVSYRVAQRYSVATDVVIRQLILRDPTFVARAADEITPYSWEEVDALIQRPYSALGCFLFQQTYPDFRDAFYAMCQKRNSVEATRWYEFYFQKACEYENERVERIYKRTMTDSATASLKGSPS